MARIRSIPLALALAFAVLLGGFPGGSPCGVGTPQGLEASPEDEKPAKKTDPKPAPKGSAYANERLGISARAPAGWKIVVNKGSAPTTWNLLVTFNDGATDAQATLSVRPRSAAALDDLMGSVRKAWDKSRDRLRVDSMRKIEASALEPVGRIVVDASFTREPKPPEPGKEGVAPPPKPPVTYRVQATYVLGPGFEYLLYAQGQKTHWSRLRTPLRQLAASVRFGGSEPAGPKGEGSYLDEKNGFSCKFPKNYTVVTPQRANHVVKFKGVGNDDPVLSVYAFSWNQDAEKDAQRLMTFYEEDKGGTASFSTREISGHEGVFVKAHASIGGADRAVLIAILKRGDTCFRLRASMPLKAEAKGTGVFNAFVDSFRLLAAPK